MCYIVGLFFCFIVNFFTEVYLFFESFWSNQEVVVEGQDKVFKDVIEPLESVSVNIIPTAKQDIRDFGAPQEVNLQIIMHSYAVK